MTVPSIITFGFCIFFLLVFRVAIDIALIKALGVNACESLETPYYLHKCRLAWLYQILQKPGNIWRRFIILPLFKLDVEPRSILLSLESQIDKDAETLETTELWDAAKLLYEITQNPIPKMISHKHKTRYVFFADPQGGLPQIHAIWSERIVVFYAYGFAESFYTWASAYQPDLMDSLEKSAGHIVIVVTKITRINNHLFDVLETERNRIWQNVSTEETADHISILKVPTSARFTIKDKATYRIFIPDFPVSKLRQLAEMNEHVGELLNI